ncbi:MAG: RHS repeat-associated core domain-containing protein [Chloroflexia bacterium]|nr:RHS repeat-associated core domain-containing protein [Chloroflexia bacterium]
MDDQRRKTEFYQAGTLVKTKYFVGNYEVEISASSYPRKIHYISGGDELAAVFIIEGSRGTGHMYYTYTDHLGSIVAITNDAGAVLERQNFDPWGRRRNYTDWSYNNIQEFTILDRGYTGHEHLYAFGIINMNGRLYDPVLGRMLSPDPELQAPGFAQNFNRFSYCFNNPLKYTDPSGNFAYWDDVIVGAIGFLQGYFSYAITTGNWGGKL